MTDDLDRICIRAQIDGKWGSYSLRELLETDEGKQAILDWCNSKLPDGMTFYASEGVTEHEVTNMVRTLEHFFGRTIYRRKVADT